MTERVTVATTDELAPGEGIALTVDADRVPDVETLEAGLAEVVVVRIELDDA